MTSTSSFRRLGSLSPAVRSKLSLALFFTGLAIAAASCAGYSINYLPSGYELGLLQELSPVFWLGFSFCLLSILEGIKRDSRRVFFIKCLMFCMLIWNIPTLVLAHPYGQDAYWHIFEASPIMLTGHVPIASEDLHYWFRYYPADFPGFHILLTSIFQIANVAPLEFASYYPLFSSALTFLAIWLFFETFLPSVNYRWALLVAILANVYVRFHVSPQSLGLVAGLLVLVATERPGLRWKAMGFLLFVFIVVSHPTTAFIIVPVVVGAWLLKVVLHRKMRALADVAPLFLCVFVLWMVLATGMESRATELAAAAPAATAGTEEGFRTGVFFIDNVLEAFGERVGGMLHVAPWIRLAVLSLYGLGSVCYLAKQWLSRAGRRERFLPIYTAFLVAPIIMTLLDLTFLESANLHDRYFLFFLLASPVLLVRLAEDIGQREWTNPWRTGLARNLAARFNRVKPRKHLPTAQTALVAAVILVALVNFSTIYCHSPLFITSDETVSASEFASSDSSLQVVGGLLIPDLAHPYRSAILRQARFVNLYPESLTTLESPSVIILDDHNRLRYLAWYGVDKYDFYANEVELDGDFDKVYCNDRYTFYWFRGDGG